MAGTELQRIAQLAIAQEASDVHLTAGQRIFFRKDGRLRPQEHDIPDLQQMDLFLREMLTEFQYRHWQEEKEADFSWEVFGRRFRGNAYVQRNRPAVALRLIPERIPSLAELGAPQALSGLLFSVQGMLLITGRTGCGKSTTLAAFLEEMNARRDGHVLTLEDPLEFEHRSAHCFISQRELGRDFLSFPKALRSALREMPDVLLVGEIRDAETMQTAMEAASTGVFVLGTLHTNGAAETAMRVEGMFPAGQRDAVRDMFAGVFQGIISQQLVPSADGGRVSVSEVLLATPASRNLIRQGKYAQLRNVMMSGHAQGMYTMEAALQERYDQGMITKAQMELFTMKS